MKFYKALDRIKLKKYSEVDKKQFALSFFSKSGFKSSKLFDKELKKKVSKFFADEKRSSLFLSKELTGLKGDFLVLRDFNKNKSEYKKYAWMKGLFANLDKYAVKNAVIYADTSHLFKDTKEQ
mgnify:FL=1